MRALMGLLFVALLAGTVVAQEVEKKAEETGRDPEAVAILEKVDRAAKAATSIRYAATTKRAGIAENWFSPAEVEAVMTRWMGNQPEKFQAHVVSTERDSDEVVDVTGGGNGDIYFLIDHQTKKAYADMDPGVLGSSGIAEFVHQTYFCHVHSSSSPFDDELNADTIELLEDEEVYGEPCYQIRVVYGGDQGQSIWFFSKNDYLPRRNILVFSIPGQGDGSMECTITRLEVNPEVDPAIFDFKLPEGYEQIDDFAP